MSYIFALLILCASFVNCSAKTLEFGSGTSTKTVAITAEPLPHPNDVFPASYNDEGRSVEELYRCLRKDGVNQCSRYRVNRGSNIERFDIPLTNQARNLPFETIYLIPSLGMGLCGKVGDDFQCKIGENPDGAGYRVYSSHYTYVFKKPGADKPQEDAVISFSKLLGVNKILEVKIQRVQPVAYEFGFDEYLWIRTSEGVDVVPLHVGQPDFRGMRWLFIHTLNWYGEGFSPHKDVDDFQPPCFKRKKEIHCVSDYFDDKGRPSLRFKQYTDQANDLTVLKGIVKDSYWSNDIVSAVAYYTDKGLEINGRLIVGFPPGLKQLIANGSRFPDPIILCGKDGVSTRCFNVSYRQSSADEIPVPDELLLKPDLFQYYDRRCGKSSDELICIGPANWGLKKATLYSCAGKDLTIGNTVARPYVLLDFKRLAVKPSNCSSPFTFQDLGYTYHFFQSGYFPSGEVEVIRGGIFIQRCSADGKPDMNFGSGGIKQLPIALYSLDLVKKVNDGFLIAGSKYALQDYFATYVKVDVDFNPIPGFEQKMVIADVYDSRKQQYYSVADINENTESFVVDTFMKDGPYYFSKVRFSVPKSGGRIGHEIQERKYCVGSP